MQAQQGAEEKTPPALSNQRGCFHLQGMSAALRPEAQRLCAIVGLMASSLHAVEVENGPALIHFSFNMPASGTMPSQIACQQHRC